MNTISEATKLSTGKELNIKYPIELYDKDGNQVYHENSDGHWWKWLYKDGKMVYYEDFYGYWEKIEHKDDTVYFKNSYGQEEYYESYTDYIEDIK